MPPRKPMHRRSTPVRLSKVVNLSECKASWNKASHDVHSGQQKQHILLSLDWPAMALQHPQRSRWVIVLVLLLTLWQRSQHFTLQELGALLMRPLAQPIVRKASSLALQYRAATDFTLQKVNLMTPEMSVQKHAKKLTKLTKRIFWGNWIWQMLGPRLGKRAPMKNVILPFDKQFLADPMNDTPFETLMRDVLQARDVGTTAVFAEPGIGKSVSTVLAVLKTNASESCMTVLLRGEFQKSLKDFFRVPDTSLALNVANSFFSQIASDGISLCIIIDNAFDGGLQGDSTALLDLTRHAFEFGHQLVVVTQSSNLAAEIYELNGVRTKIAPQQDGKRAEDFRWSEDLARQYLTRSVMTDVKKRQDVSVDEVMREWLNATKMRDGSGGWSPSTMTLYTRGYLSLGEAPPTRGRLLVFIIAPTRSAGNHFPM